MWYPRGLVNEKLLQLISRKIREKPWFYYQCGEMLITQASENRSLTHTKHAQHHSQQGVP